MQKIPKVSAFGEQVNLFENAQEGQTKQGKGGTLTLRNHRWHLDEEYEKGKYKTNVWDKKSEFSTDPEQQSLSFEQKVKATKDKYYSHNLSLFEETQLDKQEVKTADAIREEKRNRLLRYTQIINRHKVHATGIHSQFLSDLDDISNIPVNDELYAFSLKTEKNLLGEIDFNYQLTGKEELPGGVLQGVIISDSTHNTKILSELKDKGYSIIKEENEEGETGETNFRKIIVQKGSSETTKATILVMDEKTKKLFIDTQKSKNRLLETKKSLEYKEFSEAVPEYHELKQELFKNVGKGRGVCVITGGLAGAGKSTALDKNIYSNKVKIDPDDIKFILGKIRGTDLEDIKTNPMKYHEESSLLAKHLLREAMREGKDVVYDSTMKSYSTILDTAKIAKSAGYSIDGQFVHITLEEGMKRNRKRGEMGGRALSDNIYKELYGGYEPHQQFFKLKPVFDSYKMYDNMVKLGQQPPVIIKKDKYGERTLDEKRLDIIQKLLYIKGVILKALKGTNNGRTTRFTERTREFFKSIGARRDTGFSHG